MAQVRNWIIANSVSVEDVYGTVVDSGYMAPSAKADEVLLEADSERGSHPLLLHVDRRPVLFPQPG